MLHRRLVVVFLAGAYLAACAETSLADRVEFLTGSQLEGKIVARDDRYVSIEVAVGSRTITRKCPVNRIHAVVIGDQREILNAMPGGRRPSGSGSGTSTRPARGDRRSPAEVEALIDQVGRTQPDWWDTVPLDYPQTLDLSWPQPPPKGWNNQRNVGQYVWDIINPNSHRWQSGVKFMHHVLTVNQDKPDVRQRAMFALGRMYQHLLRDYARAAFWWRQGGADRRGDRSGPGVQLAECYWKLGSKRMADDLLRKLQPQFSMIKLWADMGDLQQALRLADANVNGPYGDIACIYAGDACRVAGQHQKALAYYETLLRMRPAGQAAQRVKRNQDRAKANVEAIRLFDTLDLARVPDGTYTASSLGYEAQVHVEVVVREGRIESVRVTQHREKQYYSAMEDTTEKIVEKQSVKGIDATSSATITSEAIINATAKALSEGMR